MGEPENKEIFRGRCFASTGDYLQVEVNGGIFGGLVVTAVPDEGDDPEDPVPIYLDRHQVKRLRDALSWWIDDGVEK